MLLPESIGKLMSPFAMGQGYTITGKHGNHRGITRGTKAGYNTNRRPVGAKPLRVDPTAAGKLRITRKLDSLAKVAGCQVNELSPATRKTIEKAEGYTWRTMMGWHQRQGEFHLFIAKNRLGIHGLRPFGSRLAITKKHTCSSGARMPRPDRDKSNQQPLTIVFSKVSKWLAKERLYGKEARNRRIMSRFHRELQTEKGRQDVLRDQFSPNYNDKVLDAVTRRLDKLSDYSAQGAKLTKEYMRTTVYPAIGAVARKADKKSHSNPKAEATVMQLTWASIDRAMYLVQNGSHEELGNFVQDPEAFHDKASSKVILAYDQTPVWLKLRGEEEVVITRAEAEETTERRRLSRASQNPKSTLQERAEAIRELHARFEENPTHEKEIHQEVSQGGDKYRLTVTTFQAVHNWFSPEGEARGSLPDPVLIVPCKTHCRMENIDQDGRWIQSFSYEIDGEVQEFKAGTSCHGVLNSWRKARDQNPSQLERFRVWGQPAAWTDEIICMFLSDYVKEMFPDGVLQLVDCLGSQWSERTLARTWLNQQMQIPIAPNATSCIQVADTHIHSELKAFFRQAKAELQAQWEQEAELQNCPTTTSWGPFETMHVLARGYDRLRELQAKKDIVLRGFIQNHLISYRPDSQGQLQPVHLHWPDFDQEYPRIPPGRRVSFVQAQWRVKMHESWKDGEPPEPDWSRLDTLGNYLHQSYDKEEKDEPVEWDCRFHGLELTPEQEDMMKPASQRDPPGPPIPEYIKKRVSSVSAGIQARRKNKIKSRWATTLASRKTSKAGLKWTKALSVAGGPVEFAKKLTPKAVQKAARQKFSKYAKSKAKSKAKTKPKYHTCTDDPAEAWTGPVEFSVLTDHQLLGKRVRVVGAASCPEHIGKIGDVVLVQMCRCAITGVQHCHVSVSVGGKTVHADLRDVQEEDPDVCTAAIVPFRQNFNGFAKDLPALRMALSQVDLTGYPAAA